MKQLLVVLSLLATFSQSSCQKQDRFRRTAADFPVGYVGQWEAVLPGGSARLFYAGVTIKPSGDSLLWSYFSQLVDTTTHHKIPCGPEMAFMPFRWDDSTHIALGDHGATQGYGFDKLQLLSPSKLQLNSLWLATSCRGPGGFNSSQLVFSKVNSFQFNP